MNTARIAACFVMLVLGTLAAPAHAADDDALMARSLVSTGDPASVDHVLAKARRGEPVTVAVIGGSITAGAGASAREKTYGGVLAHWWRETFPSAKITLVNAGIGATGSDYGALRARRDLLSRRPDFVVVEYGVNDADLQATAETLEGLVRQTLAEPQRPAVVLLFMMHRNGGNAQAWHGKVGRHYGLPMLSLRDALWPEIEAGRMKWEDVEADVVHPNDRGHDYAARFVSRFLESRLKSLPADDKLPAIAATPAPLLSDRYEHTALCEADALKPVANSGWTFDAKNRCWKSDRPGSRIEFAIEGRVLLLMDFHIRGPMGKAKTSVDGRTAVVQDGWFNQTWGGYRQTIVLAKDLAPQVHRVTVELLAEKNPQSPGHEYRLLGLGAAGVDRPTGSGASSGRTTRVTADNANLLSAPYVWKRTGSGDGARVEATMPGAYLKARFRGSATVGLDVDGEANRGCPASSMPVVEYSIDEGPFAIKPLTRTGDVYTLPLGVGLDPKEVHRLEVYFRAADLAQNRWRASTAHLRLAGLQLDAGGVVVPCPARKRLAIGFGDSITEGVGVDGLFTSWQALGVNNARGTWLPTVAAALDCEYGQLGSGGQGMTRPIEMPPLPETWDRYDAAHSRLCDGRLLPEPDYIFCAMGTNDFDKNIQADYVRWMVAMRKACPHARFFCIVPPLGVHAEEVRAAVAQRNRSGDPRVHLIDTAPLARSFRAGKGATQLGYDGVHPSMYGNAMLGALIAAQTQKAMRDGQ